MFLPIGYRKNNIYNIQRVFLSLAGNAREDGLGECEVRDKGGVGWAKLKGLRGELQRLGWRNLGLPFF